jgi:hypothetical protein
LNDVFGDGVFAADNQAREVGKHQAQHLLREGVRERANERRQGVVAALLDQLLK